MTIFLYYLAANAAAGACFLACYKDEFKHFLRQEARKDGDFNPDSKKFAALIFVVFLFAFIPVGIYTLIKGKS